MLAKSIGRAASAPAPAPRSPPHGVRAPPSPQKRSRGSRRSRPPPPPPRETATYWIRRCATQLFLSSIPVAILSIFFRQLVVGERTITAIINFLVLGGSSTFVAYLYFEMEKLAKAQVKTVDEDHPMAREGRRT